MIMRFRANLAQCSRSYQAGTKGTESTSKFAMAPCLVEDDRVAQDAEEEVAP